MKRTYAPFLKGMAAGVAALALLFAAVFIATTNSPMEGSSQKNRMTAKDPADAVAAIVDGMNRSDAEDVLAFVDTNSMFRGTLRAVLEAGQGRKVTDSEVDTFAGKDGAALLKLRGVLAQGIASQLQKDEAQPGMILYALVHISEGKIEPKGSDRFAVVYADGTFLDFARREGSWKAVEFGGIEQYVPGWKAKADELIRSGQVYSPGQVGGGSPTTEPSGP